MRPDPDGANLSLCSSAAGDVAASPSSKGVAARHNVDRMDSSLDKKRLGMIAGVVDPSHFERVAQAR